jgi:hypothetical protein
MELVRMRSGLHLGWLRLGKGSEGKVTGRFTLHRADGSELRCVRVRFGTAPSVCLEQELFERSCEVRHG